MARMFVSSAAALAMLAFAMPAFAQAKARATVAGDFIAAAQAQDRVAILKLLDEKVSIQFPVRAKGAGHAQGQPFVIGYLDGLFERTVNVANLPDSDGVMHFLARDQRNQDLYAIDVEVRGDHVVNVNVELQSEDASTQTVADAS